MTSPLRRFSLVAMTSIGMLVASTGIAFSQAVDLKTTAKQYVADGLAAQTAGRYDEAIALYNKAYDLVPHPELLFNLGQAYRLKGNKPVALNYYLKYLAVDTHGRGAAEAVEWSKQLERELREAEESRKAEEARKIETARRAEAARQAEIARKAEMLRAHPAKEEAQSVSQSPATDSREVDLSSRENTVSKESGTLTVRRKVALAMGAGALLSFGGSYLAYVRWSEIRDELDEKEARGETYDAVATWTTWGVPGFGILGLGLAGTGVYLWATGGPRHLNSGARAARLVPLVSPEVTGAVISGSF